MYVKKLMSMFSSQTALAKAMHICPQTISDLMTGDRNYFSCQAALKKVMSTCPQLIRVLKQYSRSHTAKQLIYHFWLILSFCFRSIYILYMYLVYNGNYSITSLLLYHWATAHHTGLLAVQ